MQENKQKIFPQAWWGLERPRTRARRWDCRTGSETSGTPGFGRTPTGLMWCWCWWWRARRGWDPGSSAERCTPGRASCRSRDPSEQKACGSSGPRERRCWGGVVGGSRGFADTTESGRIWTSGCTSRWSDLPDLSVLRKPCERCRPGHCHPPGKQRQNRYYHCN